MNCWQIGNLRWLVNNLSESPRFNKKCSMQLLLDVIDVKPTLDFKLLLQFENDEERVFDMTPYLQKKPFLALKAFPLFSKASVLNGTVVWPGDLDIAPETLYDRSYPVCTHGYGTTRLMQRVFY